MDIKEEAAKTNWLALVILFLIVVGIGIASYWCQKKYAVEPTTDISLAKPTSSPTPTEDTVPDETSDWKTYTNQKYNFSIKYHPTWAFKEYETEKLSVAFAVAADALPKEQTDEPACISISIQPKMTDSQRTSDPSKIEKETIKIGNVTAEKVTLLPGREDDMLFENDQIANVEIPIENNEVISISNFDDCHLNIFIKMVNSFRFLE